MSWQCSPVLHLKKKKRDKYIKNGCPEKNMLEVEKGFYLSFVAFVECWLLVCREKNSLLGKSLLLPLVPILQAPLCTFFLWREMFSGLHPTELFCFTWVSHRRGSMKVEIAKTCPFFILPDHWQVCSWFS